MVDKRVSFLAEFGLKLGNRALDGFTSALARFDPRTASEADLAMLEKDVGVAAKLKVEAADEVHGPAGFKSQIEQGKADLAEAMTALGILKSQHDAATSESDKADLARRANIINGQIDEIEAELERDRISLQSAEEWLTHMTTALDEAAQVLSEARRNLDDAQRDAKRAAQERKMAEKSEERTAQLAGLRSATSHLGVAAGAMRSAAADDRMAAAVSREKAKALGASAISGADEVKRTLAGIKKPAGDAFARLKQTTDAAA